MFFPGCLSTESLHPSSTSTKDPSLYLPSIDSTVHLMSAGFLADILHEVDLAHLVGRHGGFSLSNSAENHRLEISSRTRSTLMSVKFVVDKKNDLFLKPAKSKVFFMSDLI